MSQFGGPWAAAREAEAEAPPQVTTLPAPSPQATPPPDWPWTGLGAARVEAVQVGGLQYRVLQGSFGVDALGARCYWTTDGGLQFEAALSALQAVRLHAAAPPAGDAP